MPRTLKISSRTLNAFSMLYTRILTYYGEVHLKILRGRIFEIYSTPVDPFIVQLNRFQRKSSRFRHGNEVSSRANHGAVRPIQSFVKCSSSHVETKTVNRFNIPFELNEVHHSFQMNFLTKSSFNRNDTCKSVSRRHRETKAPCIRDLHAWTVQCHKAI